MFCTGVCLVNGQCKVSVDVNDTAQRHTLENFRGWLKNRENCKSFAIYGILCIATTICTTTYIMVAYKYRNTGDYVKCIIQQLQLKIYRAPGIVPACFPSGTMCREKTYNQ